ncbi:hypothetical protein VNI00_003003 [Paramarasmius palmivorus]|uniref:histidine kinase n=1 Tax=Paramarasmius palmivorus TaxID=297713 RepID=A0AAW0DZC1_9AGAR
MFPWSRPPVSKWSEEPTTSTPTVDVNLERDKNTISSISRTPESFTPTKSVDLPAPATQTQRRKGFLRRKRSPNTPYDQDHSNQSKWSESARNFFAKFSSPREAPAKPILGHPDGYEMRQKDEEENVELPDEIDEIVVDRLWSQPTSRQSSENGDVDDDDSSTCSSIHTTNDGSSFNSQGARILESPYNPYNFVRWTFWPKLYHFFSPRFEDRDMEADYRREDWQQSKRLALVASVFFLVNWILGMSTIATPVVLADQIYYYGIAPVLSLPLIFMCAYNWPRDHPVFYQCFVCCSAWAWSLYQVIFAYLCGYSSNTIIWTCGTKDFLQTFYYTTALQTIALFGTNLKRLPTTLGAIVFLVLSAVLIIPSRGSWYRYMLNFIVFQAFLLYMHYKREMLARRFFRLQIEFKLQLQRTQKAQANERRAADSKYRLTSYVFHDEYYVAALLQYVLMLRPLYRLECRSTRRNMSASGTIAKSQEIEFNALEGSLSMMSKVLNDMLDFNRMDSGNFESLSRPYAFHQVMRSLFLPLKLATNHRKLELVTELDPNIDEVARRAAHAYMGEDPASIERHLKENPSGEDNWGIVVGDELRLRQVVTNLASNACKFTPAGGKVSITTRLVFPDDKTLSGETAVEPDENESPYNNELEVVDNYSDTGRPDAKQDNIDRIIVRIEVSDTGSGIPPHEMMQSKLFSAFNQTEQGRRQGGKGTGLGLALVRLIVKLSGGRLGVRSKVNEGSTFWVELPLGVGAKAFISPDDLAIPDQPLASPKDNTFTELFKVASRGTGTGVSALSASVGAEEADPEQIRRMQAHSSSVVYGLVVEEGRYESYFSVPTRTIGDPSTGTDYPIPPTTPPDTDPRSLRKSRPQDIELPGSLADDRALTPVTAITCPPLDQRHSPCALFEPGLQVLVVDDDALTRKLMKRLLERLGCVVTTAENGDVALKILLGEEQNVEGGGIASGPGDVSRVDKFSCIFLDNQMPLISGLIAVERLREARGRRDFVVGVTGNALINDQKEFLEAGADYVLTKPVLERSLKSMLHLADERRKAFIRTEVS